MNYHPLLVHFPIAFLSIYSLFEFVRLKKILRLSYWFYLKGAFLLLGTGASILTYFSGKIIEEMFFNQIVLLHSRFALLTITTYCLLSLTYLISWIDKDFYSFVKEFGVWDKISNLNKNIFRPRVIITLSVLGFVFITITGGLGGIIAFGPGVDPFTQFINEIFFGNAKY